MTPEEEKELERQTGARKASIPPNMHPVSLTPPRVGCIYHGAPFEEEWPKGFAIFAIEAAKAAFSTPEVQEALGEERDPFKVTAIFDKVTEGRPLCSFMPLDKLMDAYIKSGIGRIAPCLVCGSDSLGTRYVIEKSNINYKHLCFACLVYGPHDNHHTMASERNN